MSAVHKDHYLDQRLGPYGYKRGDYEIMAVNILRLNGHSIILESERVDVGSKQYDGLFDGHPCEIKAIEGAGRWAVRTKIHDAAMQGAHHVVLVFPNKTRAICQIVG